MGRADTVGHILGGLIGTFLDAGHIAQKDRRAALHADDEVGHFLGAGEEGAGLDQDFVVAVDQAAGVAGSVGGGQRPSQIVQRQVVPGQAVRIEGHAHHPFRTADDLDVTGAGYALDLGFHGAGDAQQIGGRDRGILAPERSCGDGDIVDALGFDQRLAHARVGRQPVLIGEKGIVEADDGLGARFAHLELHGQRRHSWGGGRIDVFDALDLRDDLLGGCRHQRLDLGSRSARIGNEDIGERDVDLRFLFARRDQHREQTEQQAGQRQERGDFRAQERGCNASGQPKPGRGGVVHSASSPRPACLEAMAAAIGSAAMRSPATSPASTGTRSLAVGVPVRR